MKLTIKSLAILMMASVGITACSDDDNNVSEKPKEYALAVKFSLEPNDTALRGQLIQTVEAAMSNAGISKDGSYLYITARDSADAAPRVKEIGSKLEAVLDRNADKMHGDAYIMAIDRQQLEASDTKQRDWTCWYAAVYPAADNSVLTKDWFKKVYYAYDLKIINGYWASVGENELFNTGDPRGECCRYCDSDDLNRNVGGSYLYLTVTGVTDPTHPDYKDRLITDVVMLNTGGDAHYPEYADITKGGKSRRYYPVFTKDKGANGSTKHDLNHDAGGPYLWLYYTTDYRDGLVLTSKSNEGGSWWYTSVINGDYDTGKVNTAGSTDYGHYMHAYTKQSGKWVDSGLANFNEGLKKKMFRSEDSSTYLELAFRKVQ